MLVKYNICIICICVCIYICISCIIIYVYIIYNIYIYTAIYMHTESVFLSGQVTRCMALKKIELQHRQVHTQVGPQR